MSFVLCFLQHDVTRVLTLILKCQSSQLMICLRVVTLWLQNLWMCYTAVNRLWLEKLFTRIAKTDRHVSKSQNICQKERTYISFVRTHWHRQRLCWKICCSSAPALTLSNWVICHARAWRYSTPGAGEPARLHLQNWKDGINEVWFHHSLPQEDI